MHDYEVEMKFALQDDSSFRSRLQQLGAVGEGTIEQSDQYFSHPSRDFSQTNEALRLRSVGGHNHITYKGPLLDSSTKTRQEIELEFASGPETAGQMWALLRALGFEEVRTVEKQRELFRLSWCGRNFSLTIDRVKGLGTYTELETLAGSEDWEAARDCTMGLARELGLSESERRSYLQMLVELDDSK